MNSARRCSEQPTRDRIHRAAGVPACTSAKHERAVTPPASHSHAVYGVVNVAVKFRGRFKALNTMSNRSYAEINFHITWHTKDNFPFIDSKLEPELWAFIKDRIVKMPNVYFHAIGGIQDHIHLASSFYPPFEIDRWKGEIKERVPTSLERPSNGKVAMG